MAGVTGPTNLLPGSVSRVPPHTKCDNHPDTLASYRLTGEVDSFGSEYSDLCDACYDKYKKGQEEKDTSGFCEWHKGTGEDIRPFRDIDEGSTGRTYDVCRSCRKDYLANLD